MKKILAVLLSMLLAGWQPTAAFAQMNIPNILDKALAIATTVPYKADGTLQPNVHAVFGTVTLALGTATVTLVGAAAFTSATTYICTASSADGTAVVVGAQPVTGSTFKVTGTLTTMVTYICVGN